MLKVTQMVILAFLFSLRRFTKFSLVGISIRWNEYRILTIITSTLLLKSSTYIQSSEIPRDHTTSLGLNRLIQQQLENICVSATHLYSAMSSTHDACQFVEARILRGTQILTLIWPLYCASQLSGNTQPQQECMREILWNIGTQGRMPVAMSMVGLPRSVLSKEDTLIVFDRRWKVVMIE
jgi:hypothetical protein